MTKDNSNDNICIIDNLILNKSIIYNIKVPIQHWQLRDMLKTTNDGIIYCSNNKVCKLILDDNVYDNNIYDTCESGIFESDIYNNITTNSTNNINITNNHTNTNHNTNINNTYNIVVIMEDLPFYPTTIDVCTIGNDNIIVVAGHNGYFAIKTKDRVIIERIGDTIINSVRILILDCNNGISGNNDDRGDRGDNGIGDSDRGNINNTTNTNTNNHTKHINNTSNTNTLVLFSSNDTTIKIYSIEYNTIIQSLEHQWPVNNCEYNKDKDILITVGDTDEINIFKRNKNICCLECYKYDNMCDKYDRYGGKYGGKSVIDSNNDRCDRYDNINDNNITTNSYTNNIHNNHNNTNHMNMNIKDIYEYYTTIKTYKDASFKISFNNNYIFSVSTQDGYVVVYDIRNIINNCNNKCDNDNSNNDNGNDSIINNNTTNNTNNNITNNITTNTIINNIILHSVQNNTIRGAIRNVLFINYKSLDLMVYTEHNTYFTIVDCRTFKYKQIIDITDNNYNNRYDRYDNRYDDNSNRYDRYDNRYDRDDTNNSNNTNNNTNNYNNSNININDRYDNNGKNKSKQISGLTYFKDRIFVSTEDSIYEYIINNKYRRLF